MLCWDALRAFPAWLNALLALCTKALSQLIASVDKKSWLCQCVGRKLGTRLLMTKSQWLPLLLWPGWSCHCPSLQQSPQCGTFPPGRGCGCDTRESVVSMMCDGCVGRLVRSVLKCSPTFCCRQYGRLAIKTYPSYCKWPKVGRGLASYPGSRWAENFFLCPPRAWVRG